MSPIPEMEVNFRVHHIFTIVLLARAAGAYAADYHSHGLFGLYQSKESVRDGSGASTTNDQAAVLGRLYFDAAHIGGGKNQFTFDVRDRYDSFGAADRDRPRLVASNEAQVRQLAIKYPMESGKVYAALGRVPIMDAALIANDGIDAAYRASPNVRLGLFGGYYPDVRYFTQPSPKDEIPQAGFYLIYDDKSPGWEKHTLVSTSLVSRNYDAVRTGNTPEDIFGDRKNPSLLWFANMVHQASPSTRYTGMVQLDLLPQSFARNIWLGWHSLLTTDLSSSLSFVRIDATGYERQRDALDQLSPSVLTRLSADLRQRLGREWTILYDGAFGSRAVDGRSRMEGGIRLLRSGLLKGRLNIYGGGGLRKNYLSQDVLARAGGSYVWKNFDLGVQQQYVMQQRDDGPSVTSFITDVTGSTIFGNNILGTLTVEYAQGNTSRVVSGMAGLGFRIGSGQTTPPAQSPIPPPPVERL